MFASLIIDLAIGKIKAACEENGYILFITADHGNAEKMFSEQGGPHTAHTTYRGMGLGPFLCLWNSYHPHLYNVVLFFI